MRSQPCELSSNQASISPTAPVKPIEGSKMATKPLPKRVACEVLEILLIDLDLRFDVSLQRTNNSKNG